MAATGSCPRCGLLSPPEAVRCDCGYDFSSGETKQSLLTGRRELQRVHDRLQPVSGSAIFWLLAPLAVGLVTPSLVILYLEVSVGHVSLLAAASDILYQQLAEGHNLLLLALIGLIPFAVLSVTCFAAARRLSPPRLACLGVGGLLGVLGLMVPGHVAIWSSKPSTAVLGFIWIPLFCLVTLAIGLFAGWGLSLTVRNANH